MPPATLDELVAPHLELGDGTSKGGNKAFTCVHCKSEIASDDEDEHAIEYQEGNEG